MDNISRGTPCFRSGGTQLVTLWAVLIACVLLTGMVAWPVLETEYLRRVAIPRLGSVYGFRVGDFDLPATVGESAAWGVSAVEPGGIFDQAGVRSGDELIDYHYRDGGARALYAVLTGAKESFQVLNINDRSRGDEGVRMIILPVTPPVYDLIPIRQ